MAKIPLLSNAKSDKSPICQVCWAIYITHGRSTGTRGVGDLGPLAQAFQLQTGTPGTGEGNLAAVVID